jgi:hypothetical protein
VSERRHQRRNTSAGTSTHRAPLGAPGAPGSSRRCRSAWPRHQHRRWGVAQGGGRCGGRTRVWAGRVLAASSIHQPRLAPSASSSMTLEVSSAAAAAAHVETAAAAPALHSHHQQDSSDSHGATTTHGRDSHAHARARAHPPSWAAAAC